MNLLIIAAFVFFVSILASMVLDESNQREHTVKIPVNNHPNTNQE